MNTTKSWGELMDIQTYIFKYAKCQVTLINCCKKLREKKHFDRCENVNRNCMEIYPKLIPTFCYNPREQLFLADIINLFCCWRKWNKLILFLSWQRNLLRWQVKIQGFVKYSRAMIMCSGTNFQNSPTATSRSFFPKVLWLDSFSGRSPQLRAPSQWFTLLLDPSIC